MSAVIVLLMIRKYALPYNWMWQEHVSLDNAANRMELQTAWESKVGGNMSGVIVQLMKKITHCLRVKSGRNKSAMMVHWQHMELYYALLESQHCPLSPTMIAILRLCYSVYSFAHLVICLLDLQMEESHPWREWNMNRFCTVDFVQGSSLTLTLSWWKPMKNTDSKLIGNRFLVPSHERTLLL